MEATDLNDLLDNTLEGLLFQQLTRHVPDDERVGILDHGYWVGWIEPGTLYSDVKHRLPQLTRSVGAGHLVVTLGRHGGIRVTNRIGDDLNSGVWIDCTFEADPTPADS